MQYITNYGGHLSEQSDPDRLNVIRELVAGQTEVHMLDLMAAASYTDTTIAKALLKLGWLQVADSKPMSSSTWEKVAESMASSVTFRPRYVSKSSHIKPAPAPEVPTPGVDGWMTVEPDGTQPLSEVRSTLASLGFEVRLQMRPRVHS